MIPDTLFGAILGYAAFAPLPKSPDEPETEENCIYSSYPSIMNAISINFDSVGYATSLARAFNWVRELRQCNHVLVTSSMCGYVVFMVACSTIAMIDLYCSSGWISKFQLQF